MAESAIRARRFSDVTAALFLTMLAAGVLLRFYQLGSQGFWLDELWTAAASDPALSLGQWMRQWILPDVHPPLYLFLVREWRLLFGDSEISLRLLSVVLSLGLIVTVPIVQKWTPVIRKPLMLTAWFACSAGVILYARDARPYALLLLLTTVATLLSVAIAARMERNEPIVRPCCILAAVVIMAEYSHYFGALMGIGMFGTLLLFAAAGHRRYLWTVALSGLAAGGVLLPWLALHVSHLSGKLGGEFWVRNNWTTTFPAAADLAAGSWAIFLLIAACIARVLTARPCLMRQPDCFVPLTAVMLILLGAVAVSLHSPVITQRNLLVLLPPFYVLATTVVAELWSDATGRLRIAVQLASAAVIATSLGYATYRILTDGKDEWRAAAVQVASLPGCLGSTIQVHYWPEAIYAYYLPPAYRHNLRTVLTRPQEGNAVKLVSKPGGNCPLILWSGHMVAEQIVREVIGRLGLRRDQVIVRKTRGNMLILDRQRLPAGSP